MKQLGRGFGAGNAVLRAGDREIFRQPLYDRKNLVASATTLPASVSFFTKPSGDSDTLIRYQTAASVTKTKRDTNLPSNGQDPGRDYTLVGIGCSLIPLKRTASDTNAQNITSDKYVIKENGYLIFKIVDKEILTLPLTLLPEVNPEGGASTTVTSSTAYGNSPAALPMWPFGDRIMLPRGQNFNVSVYFDSGTMQQAFDMAIYLFADMRRPT